MACRSANANDDGILQVFHRLTHYPARPGVPATPWDDGNFAIAGDIYQGYITILPLDDGHFERVPNAQVVLTDAALDQHLAGNPNAGMVGPFAVGDPNTETVST